MSLPLVGTAVLYYTLERIREPPPPLATPPSPEHESTSTPSPPRTTSHRTPSKRSFTPKLTKSRIVQPTTTSDPPSGSIDTPSTSSMPPSPSPSPASAVLSPSARRRVPLPSTPSSSTTCLPTRPRTVSSSSRRSSISSVGGHSTRTSSTVVSGFHPISKTSSKPLPPLLHSSGSLRSRQDEQDEFESYFDVSFSSQGGGGGGGAVAGSDSLTGKGKEKERPSESGIGLGRPPLAVERTADERQIDANKVAPPPSSIPPTLSKRSFSLPSFLKRKPSSSSSAKMASDPTSRTTQGDAKEILKRIV